MSLLYSSQKLPTVKYRSSTAYHTHLPCSNNDDDDNGKYLSSPPVYPASSDKPSYNNNPRNMIRLLLWICSLCLMIILGIRCGMYFIDHYDMITIVFQTCNTNIMNIPLRLHSTTNTNTDHSIDIFWNLFPNKHPWAMYSANRYNYSTHELVEWSGDTRKNGKVSGDILINSTHDDKTDGYILDSLHGGIDSSIHWPGTAGLFLKPLTVCAITRYADFNEQHHRERILTVDNGNWLIGHLLYSRGIAYSNGMYQDIPTREVPNDKWLSICFTNNPALKQYSVFVDMRPLGNPPNYFQDDPLSNNTTLVINGETWKQQRSDWAFSKLIIWDRALTKDEMELASIALYGTLTNQEPLQLWIVLKPKHFQGKILQHGIYWLQGVSKLPNEIAPIAKGFTVIYMNIETQSITSVGCFASNDYEGLEEGLQSSNKYLMIFQANIESFNKVPFQRILWRLSQCTTNYNKRVMNGEQYLFVGIRNSKERNHDTIDDAPDLGKEDIVRLQFHDKGEVKVVAT